MKIPFTGGCVCGAIRYECTAEPIMTFKCHCRDCQRVTGGGFVAGLLVPADSDCEQFSMSDPLQYKNQEPGVKGKNYD